MAAAQMVVADRVWGRRAGEKGWVGNECASGARLLAYWPQCVSLGTGHHAAVSLFSGYCYSCAQAFLSGIKTVPSAGLGESGGRPRG